MDPYPLPLLFISTSSSVAEKPGHKQHKACASGSGHTLSFTFSVMWSSRPGVLMVHRHADCFSLLKCSFKLLPCWEMRSGHFLPSGTPPPMTTWLKNEVPAWHAVSAPARPSHIPISQHLGQSLTVAGWKRFWLEGWPTWLAGKKRFNLWLWEEKRLGKGPLWCCEFQWHYTELDEARSPHFT